jgi:hypothetical protein
MGGERSTHWTEAKCIVFRWENLKEREYLISSRNRWYNKFWYQHAVVFVEQRLYFLSVQTQLLEHHTFSYHLLHVSGISGHHQVDFLQ